MVRIHVLNVKLGDSIILETELNSKFYYSIIDCKSIEGKTPTVEFLRKRGITRIQSLFLTHLHNDHYSGFPQLLDYLRGVNGTLEYFVSPQIPDEVDLWRQLVEMAHDETTSAQLTAVLKAMKGFQALSSVSHPDKKVSSVRFVYEGQRGERSWHDHPHPSLLFAPVSPTPSEAFQLLQSALQKASLHNKVINSISQALLMRYDGGSRQHIGILTGDLEGQTWRYVKNRCLEITSDSIKSDISFLKVPHHGAHNLVMEQCLQELINNKSSFVASISCPAGDPRHPDHKTLGFLKNNFQRCCIVCTNISTPCHNHGVVSI
jgi:beta-lactamase superfamily II metal-dependent hydrolase